VNPRARLSSFATTRPVAILMVFLAAVVFGLLSIQRLPIQLMPELTYPTLTVRTEYPGAAPEEVENDVSRPVEEALGVIGGLRRISSVSRAGISDVVLEFAWDEDMADASQEVLEKLDRVFLPEETERPLILHFDPSLDPILELSLSGEGEIFAGETGLRRLRRIADLQVKRLLEPIKGVAAVRVRGGLEEEIHVLVEEEQLLRSGISIQQVIDRLAQENINLAGGEIREGTTEYLVRTLNEYGGLDEIEETVVATFEGRDVRIRDLGRVEMSHKEREIITRTDGGDSVQIEIFKEGDANIVDVATRVKAMVGELPKESEAAEAGEDEEAEGPPSGMRGDGAGRYDPTVSGIASDLYRQEGVRLQLMADRSVFIEQSLNEVRNTLVFGAILAIFVLYLFLRKVMPTLIVAVSIPMSVAMTFAPLNLMGASLNIMSLGGLAMGIGMLVDSSIVVLESIFRCREEGDDISTSAVRGTREVRMAVFASTLTSIAVFLPMVFVEGLAGQAFGDLGLAVVVSLLAALIVALFFIPMLASRQWKGLGGDESRLPFYSDGRFRLRNLARFHSLGKFVAAFRDHGWIIRILGAVYFVVRLLLGLVVELLGKILSLVVMGLIAAAYFLFVGIGLVLRPIFWAPLKFARWTLDTLGRVYPRIIRWALAHPGVIILILAACLWGTWQVTTSLESELLPEVYQGEFTVEVALPVGTPLERTAEVLNPVEEAILQEKENIQSLLLTLGFDSRTSQRSDEGEHTAYFKVILDEHSRGAAAEQRVIDRLRGRFRGIPDLEARVVRPVLFSSKTPIEVEIQGEDLRLIKRVSDQAKEIMSGIPELADVESTLRTGAPEVQIIYDRDRLARYGLNIGEVARLVRDKVKGYEATRYNLKDRRIPILVRLAIDDRETVEEVRGINVNPGGDRPIPLASVAAVTLGEGPSEVRRIDSQRVAVIGANITTGASLSTASARIQEALHGRIEWPAGMTFFLSGQNEEWERSRGSLWLALGLSVFLVYVIMAAQFESLLHPLVIMLTIPLAMLGSVIVLKFLGISLSIVVFLGMIMLAGIVVNNAIVLIDYINTLRGRGMDRDEAIVTGGKVRLRPILMTTATTVLGLLPMAIGVGDGAEIRTPMAITVIAGLISSTVLTLVLIPSFYAIVDSLKDWVIGGRTQEVETPGVGGAGTREVTP
jgi:HAE1 family hydrophobic/amphiphilic exporter-1